MVYTSMWCLAHDVMHSTLLSACSLALRAYKDINTYTQVHVPMCSCMYIWPHTQATCIGVGRNFFEGLP